jgi:hypothetical protein
MRADWHRWLIGSMVGGRNRVGNWADWHGWLIGSTVDGRNRVGNSEKRTS